jgi:hypothetical protein
VFGPHGSHLFIGRKFATRGGSSGARDGGVLLWQQRGRRWFVVPASKPHNNSGNVVLLIG